MTALRVTESADELLFTGPGGSVSAALATRREPEEGDRDRVSFELTMPVEEDGAPQLKILLWAYTHDSYDGEHRDVLEDGILCATLVARVAAATGVELEPSAFIDAVSAAMPDYADTLACLREELENGALVAELYGPNL